MPFTFSAMRVMSVPRSRRGERSAFSRGCERPAAPRARQNPAQDPAKTAKNWDNLSCFPRDTCSTSLLCWAWSKVGLDELGDFFHNFNEPKNNHRAVSSTSLHPGKLCCQQTEPFPPAWCSPCPQERCQRDARASLPQHPCPGSASCPAPAALPVQVGTKGLKLQLPAQRCGVMLKLFPLPHEVSCH